MQGSIFVSYRREDAAASAGRLCDHLLRHFPRERIFFDVDTIEPGLDFVKVLDSHVSKCDVLLAVIGRDWVTAELDGEKRLAQAHDFVRIELESALKRDIRVVPILVDGARMPNERELPEGLKSLARRQGVEIEHTSFAADTERLIEALERYFQSLRPEPMPVAAAKPENALPIRADLAVPPQSELPSGSDRSPVSLNEASGPPPASPVATSPAPAPPFDARPVEPSGSLPVHAGSAATTTPAPKPAPAQAAFIAAGPSYSRTSNLIAALLSPVFLAVVVLYPVLDLGGSSRKNLLFSSIIVAAVALVPLVAVLIARHARGEKANPFLLYCSLGWAIGAAVGSLASLDSEGPWPLFAVSMALVAGACIRLLDGRFAPASGSTLIYAIYFTPMVAFVFLAWNDVRAGLSSGEPDLASVLAIGYLLAYLVPYVLIFFKRRARAAA